MLRTNDDIPIVTAVSAVFSEITVVRFEATPSSIGPFSASLLSWDVVGPDQGFFLDLDGRRVPLRGEMVVIPPETQTFVLRARASGTSRVLGRVTIFVNLTGCQSSEVPDVGDIIERTLNSVVDDDPKLYFRTLSVPGQVPKRSKPIVKIDTNRITFALALRYSVDDAPDPSVDIDVSFELGVTNGVLVTRNEDISVDVRVPPYLWLVPGAMIALPIAISNGKEKARRGARDMLRLIAATLNFHTFVPDRALHSVQIEVVEPDVANLELVHCPEEPLRGLLPEELAPIQ